MIKMGKNLINFKTKMQTKLLVMLKLYIKIITNWCFKIFKNYICIFLKNVHFKNQ